MICNLTNIASARQGNNWVLWNSILTFKQADGTFRRSFSKDNFTKNTFEYAFACLPLLS